MTRESADLTFRPMEAGDRDLRAEALLRNFNRTAERFTHADLDAPPLSVYLPFDPARGDVGHVVLSGGRAVGMAAAVFAQGYGHISDDIPELWIHVGASHRNVGIGARLIDLILQDGRAAGWPGLSLSVEDGNPARRLYRRKGFTDHLTPGVMLLQLGPDHPLRSVAVYCGSSYGAREEYVDAARELGHELAARGLTLIYGGGDVGLMGAVADAVVDRRGAAFGVIPRQLVDREMAHRGLARLDVVETMAERKTRMEDLADAFIALPGGAGTLEELFEVLTMQQLGHLTGPIGLCNTAGFWDPLVEMLRRAVDEGFLRGKYLDALVVADTPAEVLARFDDWTAPGRKWD